MKKNNSKNTLRHLQAENKRLQKALKEATGKFNDGKRDEGGEVSISMIANDRLENDSVKITISQIKEHEKKFENEEVLQNA